MNALRNQVESLGQTDQLTFSFVLLEFVKQAFPVPLQINIDGVISSVWSIHRGTSPDIDAELDGIFTEGSGSMLEALATDGSTPDHHLASRVVYHSVVAVAYRVLPLDDFLSSFTYSGHQAFGAINVAESLGIPEQDLTDLLAMLDLTTCNRQDVLQAIAP